MRSNFCFAVGLLVSDNDDDDHRNEGQKKETSKRLAVGPFIYKMHKLC